MTFAPFIENPTFIILLVLSLVFKFFPPKKINYWYGYRTTRSKLNQKNWDRAQQLSSSLLLTVSLLMVIIQIIVFYFVPAVYPINFILLLVWGISIALLFYLVEKQLKEQ
jgi:uncharacterized membrane protein